MILGGFLQRDAYDFEGGGDAMGQMRGVCLGKLKFMLFGDELGGHLNADVVVIGLLLPFT